MIVIFDNHVSIEIPGLTNIGQSHCETGARSIGAGLSLTSLAGRLRTHELAPGADSASLSDGTVGSMICGLHTGCISMLGSTNQEQQLIILSGLQFEMPPRRNQIGQ